MRMNVPTPSQMAANIALRPIAMLPQIILAQIAALSMVTDIAFALGRITLFCSQSFIMGPKVGRERIHW